MYATGCIHASGDAACLTRASGRQHLHVRAVVERGLCLGDPDRAEPHLAGSSADATGQLATALQVRGRVRTDRTRAGVHLLHQTLSVQHVGESGSLMADIRIEGVGKTYPGGKVAAVDNINLTIHDGEFMVLLGPSGCGKTTLLRMIAGLEYPDSGRISIGDRDVTDLPPRKRGLAMVFQSYAVFPHLTVFENIAFGLRMQKRPSAEVRGRVEHAAGLLQLEPYLQRFPAQLSGGQRQRVAVARAIVMEPAVLLMDEPLSNLDALLRLQFRAELKKLVSEVDRKSTRLNSSHMSISYAVFCLK